MAEKQKQRKQVEEKTFLYHTNRKIISLSLCSLMNVYLILRMFQPFDPSAKFNSKFDKQFNYK